MPRGASYKIALISDLHGKRADGLAERLREEEVDLIAVAGDLAEGEITPEEADAARRAEGARMSPFARFVHRTLRKWERHASLQNQDHIYTLLAACAALAPTVYAPGNHELTPSDAVLFAVRASGAVYLCNSAVSVPTPWGGVTVGGTAALPDRAFTEQFALTAGVRILLCHRPELYDEYPAMRQTELVLSGHAHGGQIRLFGRGLFAPGQGFFPRYTGGIYHGRLAVGRGLANTTFLPRLGNPRELPIITLTGKGE